LKGIIERESYVDTAKPIDVRNPYKEKPGCRQLCQQKTNRRFSASKVCGTHGKSAGFFLVVPLSLFASYAALQMNTFP